MTNIQLFSVVIDLYKSCKESLTISSGFIKLSDSLSLTAEQAEILIFVFKHRDEFKSFNLVIDHDSVQESSSISEGALCSEIKIELSPYSHCRFSFYKNEAEMLKRLSTVLLQGKSLPELYYLTEIDFRSDSLLTLTSILNLQSITRWLSFLKKISDIQKNTDLGICLYFLIKSGNDKFTKPLEINISNIENLCALKKVSTVDDIEMLISDTEQGNLHSKDKQSFFKLALVDVIRTGNLDYGSQDQGINLFNNLDKVKFTYYEHYEVFIHNFAIGEFQQQIQDKWFDFSEKISGVLSDIKAKLYAVPIVLVSLGTLSALADVYSYVFICIGVFVTGMINHWMVNDQEKRLNQIGTSSNYIFEKITKKGIEQSESTDIFKEINNVTSNISGSISSGKSKIKMYKLLCWLPTFVMVTLFLLKEQKKLLELFNINLDSTCFLLTKFAMKFISKMINFYLR